jgi:hypothetical protein
MENHTELNNATDAEGTALMTAATDRTGRNPDGRFAKGNSGNTGRPRGSRNRATLAAEALLDGEVEALTRKVIDLALEGDSTALRPCLERIIPARKDRPVQVDLPRINAASDLIAAAAALTDAVATGEITPAEAGDLSKLVANTARAIEVTQLEERIRKIEEAQAAKGGA